MDQSKVQQILIGTFSILLIVTLMIVATFEVKKTTSDTEEIDVDKESAACINCHELEHVAVTQIDAWAGSEHARMGIGCVECHSANENDFDAQRCPENDVLRAYPKFCVNGIISQSSCLQKV